MKQQIKAGKVNLDDPAFTTIALLKLNAVVGVVTAFANPDGSVKSMGIQCAFCHSTVDKLVPRPVSASGSTVGPTAT